MKFSRGLMLGAGAVAGAYAARTLARKRIDTLPYGYGIKIKKAVTIDTSADPLYNFWRNLANLPQLSDNVVSVDIVDDRLSHWVLRAPGGLVLEWDAEITVDRKNEMIGWRSLAGAGIDNAGYVRFERATGGRDTVVRVALQYNPPAGKVGAAVAAVLGEKPESQIDAALRKFKQLMEAGESSTVADQSTTSESPKWVEVASEDSFPASDPPAWTGTTGP